MPVTKCHMDPQVDCLLSFGKLSSVEVTYLGSMLSKHPIPVPVTVAKHDGLVCALCQ